MKTIIEAHIMQEFAPSNLNRDENGSPKDAFYGGVRRARISSQCSKKAVRGFFGEKCEEGLFSEEELGFRTRRVFEKVAEALPPTRDRAAGLEKARIALSCAGIDLDTSKPKENLSQTLIFMGRRELVRVAGVVEEHWDSLIEEPTGEAAAAMSSAARQETKKAIEATKKRVKGALAKAMEGPRAIDVGMFGRMLASMPETNQDSACQVAHPISTHAVEKEFDYFAAVDDFQPRESNGAGMLGMTEFNSACYYRYGNLNVALLADALKDPELTHRTIRVFLDAFVRAIPSGKQSSFAAYNEPDFIAISVRHHCAPRNLSNAFATPIYVNPGESLMDKSTAALCAKAAAINNAYGANGDTWVLNLTGADSSKMGTTVETLEALLDGVMAGVQV